MKQRRIILYIFIVLGLGFSAHGQLLNLAFRSNNQQILEDAIKGSFIKVVQSYELCDTTSNERFGREGNSYFSQIPYLGIETSEGLILPIEALTPWCKDEDFAKYEGKYKPLLTETNFQALDLLAPSRENVPSLIDSNNTIDMNRFVCFNDSVTDNLGLLVDSIPGQKTGWLIWATSPKTFNQSDSIKVISIRRDISIPDNASPITVEKPNTEDEIIGGIYIVPVQTKIGQINLYISGILNLNENEWEIFFPFISEPKKEEKPLTPVKSREGWNQLKPKSPKQ